MDVVSSHDPNPFIITIITNPNVFRFQMSGDISMSFVVEPVKPFFNQKCNMESTGMI